MNEQQTLLIPERDGPQIDASLIASFDALHEGVGAFYSMLTPKGEAKNAALNRLHNDEDADLRATYIDLEDVAGLIDRMKAWKRELLDMDIDPDIKQAYRWKINENIANMLMIQASAQGDMRNFERWNTFIYGEPDIDLYRAALDWIGNDADAYALSEDREVRQAAAWVQALVEGKRGYRELLSPSPELFEAVRKDHYRTGVGYYSLLLAGVQSPKSEHIERSQGHGIVEHVVRENLQSNYEIVDADGTAWGISHSREEVKEPSVYKMTWKRFVGLALGHELGTHVLEQANGERGPLGLARVGLDRAEGGGEGRALVREQVVFDSFTEFTEQQRWRDVLLRSVTINYANGVGDAQPHSSKDVYAFIEAINLMYQLATSTQDKVKAREVATSRTDTLILRVLKGTDGTGGAYRKDEVYLKGNVASWLTAEMGGVERITQGDIGKFDINNPRHIVLLQKLGMLPNTKQMDELEV